MQQMQLQAREVHKRLQHKHLSLHSCLLASPRHTRGASDSRVGGHLSTVFLVQPVHEERDFDDVGIQHRWSDEQPASAPRIAPPHPAVSPAPVLHAALLIEAEGGDEVAVEAVTESSETAPRD